jgi:hypothetical protein
MAVVFFSRKLFNTICEQIAEGKSLREICKAKGMPHRSNVFRWIDDDPTLRDQYVRAREAQADLYADEIIEIADDGSRDYSIGENGETIVDHDVIARARLRVDARKWKASKLAPKKYGDKLLNEHSGPDGGAITQIVRTIIDPQHDAS